MNPLRVLFIGGSGIISTACVAQALACGHEVHVLNRGASTLRPVPEGVVVHRADVRDAASVAAAVGDLSFDVVCQFLGFVPEQVLADVAFFAGRTEQYVYISSASAYQTPPTRLPVTESTPLRNPYWQYSRDKIACEDALVAEYRRSGFPVTIVRPSHTYDPTMVPFDGGWTVVDRMRRGLEVVVPGDGTSLWTITHHTDFARGFVGLLGRREAIGEAFHIMGDEAPTWNAIYTLIGHAAGVEPRLVHVPSDAVAAVDPEWGSALLGDKANSMVFDTTKLRSLVPDFGARVPFEQGAREIIAWHDAHPEAQAVDPHYDRLMDLLVDAYRPRDLRTAR
ncbi:MAG: SDR family oxidoreductase [Propioniciclava sp.]|uniref:SDR family oxidoreductase n=1 Tax=Propioniciclava sp. TaxID=2038686 RepID=UPI0039E53C37